MSYVKHRTITITTLGSATKTSHDLKLGNFVYYEYKINRIYWVLPRSPMTSN